MTRQRILPAVTVLLAAALTSGCAFSRTVINENGKDRDVSFITVGETTYDEVLERLGPPDVPIKNLRVFQYRQVDKRTTGFRITYFIFLPWAWYDQVVENRLVIELDEKGVVSHVARTQDQVVRPPFQGEEDRPGLKTEIITDGGKA